ncbi:MarR family winged helix-turn-helix transcriptional regulator [Nocardia pseudovaccinii]|uniref:MarR family winged helix-turn-helix transcriptional regulator n=1 Tax=Nocardia pseudovaccinii TaxID=189540 RepID=UPI0007A40D5F|nr:MarR family transcriptional regulator [Nocardia pseudovaccinii]
MPEKRPDLAAMIAPLGRALAMAELPILERHGLTMWGYVVLLGLGDEPVYTQAALAKKIRADKTRIIGTLDELQQRGLIRRDLDPADRRARLISLTPTGRTTRGQAQHDIQEQENRLLAQLPAADRKSFLRSLQTLWASVVDPSS